MPSKNFTLFLSCTKMAPIPQPGCLEFFYFWWVHVVYTFIMFNFFLIKDKKAPDKVCVRGLIRGCWPHVIRDIGCISLTRDWVYLPDQGVPSAWQCELSGLFPPISPTLNSRLPTNLNIQLRIKHSAASV